MSDPRPAPTMVGLVNTGRAHLAYPDKALYCNATKSVTGELKRLGTGAGQDETIAALLSLGVKPELVCRRCLPLAQFRDNYATAWVARCDAAPQAKPGPVAPKPIPGGVCPIGELIEIGRHTATGSEDRVCHDCAQAFIVGQEIVVCRVPGEPEESTSYMHGRCVDARVRGFNLPGEPGAADMAALRTENERLAARCRQIEEEAVQARQAAAEAGARHDAQAASLAQLAEMAEAARVHSADFLGDADFYTEGADKRRRNGLRYTMARHTELTIALSAAARGYTGPKPSDLWYPDLPALLAAHGWTETPARELTMYEDTRPMPMQAKDRSPAWLRVWRRDRDHVAAWFTSPNGMDWLSCNTRGRLAELREIERVITSKDAGRKEPLGPPKPGDGDTTMDATIDQVAAIMEQQAWTATRNGDDGGDPAAMRRFEWTKPGHGLDDKTGRRREVRVYAVGRTGQPAIVWYWAGRITVLPQLWRIAER